MSEPGLPIWVVYDHPADFPDAFVARQHIATGDGAGPTTAYITGDDLDAIRRFLQQLLGLVKRDRQPDDDPVIVETWL